MAFKAVRDGGVRMLLGSTAKLGTGPNLQTRRCALPHLDAPWCPRDVEQREGRILRHAKDAPAAQGAKANEHAGEKNDAGKDEHAAEAT